MKIHTIRQRATEKETREMLEELETYVNLAVDVERSILAGGGEYHADCEEALLEDGSRQEDVWGADWYPIKDSGIWSIERSVLTRAIGEWKSKIQCYVRRLRPLSADVGVDSYERHQEDA